MRLRFYLFLSVIFLILFLVLRKSHAVTFGGSGAPGSTFVLLTDTSGGVGVSSTVAAPYEFAVNNDAFVRTLGIDANVNGAFGTALLRVSTFTIIALSNNRVGIGYSNINNIDETLDVGGFVKVRADAATNSAASGGMGYQDTKLRFISWGVDGTTLGAYSFEQYASDGSPNRAFMTVTATGLTGIGTTNPTSTMTVAGAFNSTGTTTLGANNSQGNLIVNSSSITLANGTTMYLNDGTSRISNSSATVCHNFIPIPNHNFQVLLTSDPVGAAGANSFVTVSSTRLDESNAKLALIHIALISEQDGTGETNGVYGCVREVGGAGTCISNSRTVPLITNVAAQLSEAAASKWVILDSNKDFQASCRRINAAGMAQAECNFMVEGWCE